MTSSPDTRSQLTRKTRDAIGRVAELAEGEEGFKRLLLGTCGALIILLTLIPLLFLLWTSVWTGYPGEFAGSFTAGNFDAVYFGNVYDATELFLNSLSIAVGMTVTSLVFGLLFAWLFVRTNLPTKSVMELVLIAPLAIPSYIYALMYIATFDSNFGLASTYLSTAFGLDQLPFDIYSPWGIAFVVGINQAPTTYLFLVPAIQDMDPALEEVARVHGASIFQTIRSISLPVILPALFSAGLVSFLYGLGEFSVVAILGAEERFDVVSTVIWTSVRGRVPPQYGAAAALACSFILVTFVLVWYYRRVTRRKKDFMTMTGRSSHSRVWDLGRWRWPIAVTLWTVLLAIWVLPVVVMVLVSVQPVWTGTLDVTQLTLTHYAAAIGDIHLREAFTNSVFVSLGAATIGTILAVGMAYYTERTRFRLRGFVDFLSLTPLAVPGIIIGVSLLFTFLWVGRLHPFVDLYGTLWIIIIGCVIVFLPVSTRIAVGNIVQIHMELEESARIFGASWVAQMREIFLPLFKRTTAVIWFFLFIHTFQLITIPIMTYAPGTRVIPVELFTIYLTSADIELVSAISTAFIGLFLVVVLLLRVSGITFYELNSR